MDEIVTYLGAPCEGVWCGLPVIAINKITTKMMPEEKNFYGYAKLRGD